MARKRYKPEEIVSLLRQATYQQLPELLHHAQGHNRRIGGWIADVLHAMAASGARDEEVQQIVCAKMRALCHAFPIYPGLDAAAADKQSSRAVRWRS